MKPQEDLTSDQQAAVAEVSETKTEKGGTVKIKLHDKLGALEKIGRHLGMFTDNVNVRFPHEDALKELK